MSSVRSVPALPANPDSLRSLELCQQPPGRLREVRDGLRELAFEQLGRDEPHVDLTPAVAQQPLADGEPGWRLGGMRLLREEEPERHPLGRVEDRLRRARHRTIAGPELEGRLPARLLDRGRELRALLDERLVDEDEHLLAGAQPGCLDQVPAPAGHLVVAIRPHARILPNRTCEAAQ